MNSIFFATAPKGFEPQLADELSALGASDVSLSRSGVSFQGDLRTAYRVCLWSRVANRVLLPLHRFAAASPEALYSGIRTIGWAEHMNPYATLAVDFHCLHSAIRHSHYGALKVKDAIVDQFREGCGERPNIERERPDIRVNVFLERDLAQVSLDLSGESLHRRGYRVETVAAPLKENLAAAVLLRAGWPAIARRGNAFLDLMCGSGTLPIEAALMAADCAPGLLRAYFGFLGWKKHDVNAWEALRAEADQRRAAGLERIPPVIGYDADKRAVRAALANVERAGLLGVVHIERKELADVRPVGGEKGGGGLIVVNPPYGERLGSMGEVVALYTRFGEMLKTRFQGWRAVVLAGNSELGFRFGIRSRKPFKFYNGAIECCLLDFDVDPARFFTPKTTAAAPGAGCDERLSSIMAKARNARGIPAGGAEMLANRLRKNIKNLRRWARREGVSCYRLYDADLPEYAFAIDLYQGEKTWVHVQEYQAPASIDAAKAEARLADAVAVINEVLDIPAEQIFLKVRRKQKGRTQYERQGVAGRLHEVAENGCRFLVNFEEYLDTGLFLDHRRTRAMIGELAAGKRFLNLFAYTGTATVYAARGGARATTSVDLSKTYLEWARRNMALNGFSEGKHQFIQADCIAWLETESHNPKTNRYDLIFLDPPTFSNSKGMRAAFDVQRDHGALISKAARLLEPDGLLVFSTNFRRFKLDAAALGGLTSEQITRRTIPQDFERNPKIHFCWRISK
jgi:23S rRNA (guanine2069-N7)-methyltransferase / 23S rRNA (guanine2445-N2)-methyltransferase